MEVVEKVLEQLRQRRRRKRRYWWRSRFTVVEVRSEEEVGPLLSTLAEVLVRKFSELLTRRRRREQQKLWEQDLRRYLSQDHVVVLWSREKVPRVQYPECVRCPYRDLCRGLLREKVLKHKEYDVSSEEES